MFWRGAFGCVRQRPRAMASPAGNDQSARRAQISCIIDDAATVAAGAVITTSRVYGMELTKDADRGDPTQSRTLKGIDEPNSP